MCRWRKLPRPGDYLCNCDVTPVTALMIFSAREFSQLRRDLPDGAATGVAGGVTPSSRFRCSVQIACRVEYQAAVRLIGRGDHSSPLHSFLLALPTNVPHT